MGGKTRREGRDLIISLVGKIANRFVHTIAGHWGIESSVHWVLDVAFDEDRSRVRQGHAAESMSLGRWIGLHMLKNESSIKVGIKTKRLRAGWDEQYPLKVLRSPT